MKPETSAFIAKAKEFLERAPALLSQNFTDDAGRAAYLAGFHAAQAFIFEKQGRSLKSHGGVQEEFARLVKDESEVSAIQATEAIAGTHSFVAAIVDLLSVTLAPPSPKPDARS